MARVCVSVCRRAAPLPPSTPLRPAGAWRDEARYLDVYEEPRSYDSFVSGRALRLANDSSLWYIREDNFLYPGGIQAMYSKSRIWRLILENGLLNVYDWFLFCRTDLFWLAPVHDFRGDETHSVWVPHAGWKNDWQGYYDRAVVVHKSHAKRVLTVIDTVSAEAHPFLDALKGYPGSTGQSTNCESFWRQYLQARPLSVGLMWGAICAPALVDPAACATVLQPAGEAVQLYSLRDGAPVR